MDTLNSLSIACVNISPSYT